jgi:hypothetical protein
MMDAACAATTMKGTSAHVGEVVEHADHHGLEVDAALRVVVHHTAQHPKQLAQRLDAQLAVVLALVRERLKLNVKVHLHDALERGLRVLREDGQLQLGEQLEDEVAQARGVLCWRSGGALGPRRGLEDAGVCD